MAVFANQTAQFSCRSTQGLVWSGTSEIIREKIDITILPDHLDVEHEFELNAKAQWSDPNFPNSLEITGTLNLENSTVITGLLLWNGNKILKGKLQTKDLARRKYEEVVDRNVKNPPPPRDPAILEKVNDGVYNLSVFPVALNGSRKLRIRYLIPLAFVDSSYQSVFPYAFSQLATVTVRGGEGIQGYALTSMKVGGSRRTVKVEEEITSPIPLDADAYGQFQAYTAWSAGNQSYLLAVTPLFRDTYESRAYIASTRDSRGNQGYASHIVFLPPQELMEEISGEDTRITALIQSEDDSLIKEVSTQEIARKGIDHLRIFSSSPLKESISWKLYSHNEVVKEIDETPRIIPIEDGNQFMRTFAFTPFYPMTPTMPASLAVAWGFIDSRYALLALEQDTLSRDLTEKYASAGVPELEPEDIFSEEGDALSIPLSSWLLQKNISLEELLDPASIAALNRPGFPAGIRWFTRDGLLQIEIDVSAIMPGMQVSLHGIDGKEIKRWSSGDIHRGRMSWSPRAAGYQAGICVLRIASSTQSWSARVLLR